MDLYVIAKFLHVLIAIAWLGGAFSIVLLGFLAARKGDQDGLLFIAGLTETLAKIIFMPSSLALLLLGAFMVWTDWSFAEAWVVIGIIGVVMTGALGGAVLTPMVKKLSAMSPGAEASALATKMLRTAGADLVMLSVIVWDMVSRPSWSDWIEILCMIAVVAAGWLFFMRRGA